jgi:DNA-cytosine methyltransferase
MPLSKTLEVGTDCSGMEAPLAALDLLGVKYNHVFSSEIDPLCTKLIQNNFKPRIFYDDIQKRDNNFCPKVQLYVCGFPCQPFSNAGKREGFKASEQKGVIFFSCLDYIRTCSPETFVLENVKGLVNIEKGKTFEKILKELRKDGLYNVSWKVLNTKNYGVPQSRTRLFIVGILKSVEKTPFNFPVPVQNSLPLKGFFDKKDKSEGIIRPSSINMISALPKKSVFVDMAFNQSRHSTSDRYAPCICFHSYFWCVPLHRPANVQELLALQGFSSKHIQKRVMTDSQLKQKVGNSMSVNVLVYIFHELFTATGYKHYKQYDKSGQRPDYTLLFRPKFKNNF